MSDELIKIEHTVKSAQKVLGKLAKQTSNLRPALKAMGEYLTLSTENRFNSETDPDGNKWKEVKPRTRKRKKHSKILTEDGNLRGSIHPDIEGDSTLMVGTPSKYGAIHQLGGTIKQEGIVVHLKGKGRNTRFAKAADADRAMKVNRKITMPARPYLGVSKEDEKELVAIAEEHLELNHS